MRREQQREPEKKSYTKYAFRLTGRYHYNKNNNVYYIAKSTLQMVWIAKFKGRLWTNKKRIEFPNLIMVLQLSYGLIHRFAQLLLLDKKQFQLFLAIYIQFYLIRTDGTILCVSFIEQGYFVYVLRILCKFIASRS